MRVKFVLTMDYIVTQIHGQRFTADQLILEWEAEMSQKQIQEISHQWLHDEHFLTQRMVGMTRVGESVLTIESC